jgi:site-specific DNA-methyltransferase (adenine-specific)
MTNAQPNRPKPKLPLGQILVGDAREKLKKIPDASIDCVISSPPYFQLRDYGQEQQLGLEATIDDWVAELDGICNQLARVLKPTGSLCLVVGDNYSSHASEGGAKKSLLLGPQRLAIALANSGWVIRNQVIWAKRNPMPSSVRDRFSSSYEVVLFCVRSSRYFFDLDAVRVPHTTPPQPKRPKARHYQYLPDEAIPDGQPIDLNLGLSAKKAAGEVGHPLGGNPRDCWHLATAAYHGAHFATFPLALVERPLLATCPERVCTGCGTPWEREPVDRRQRPPTLGPMRPTCSCDADWTPGVVLDPFMGAGTTAIAAEGHQRDWVGIELSPIYAGVANRRIQTWRKEQQRKQQKETNE